MFNENSFQGAWDLTYWRTDEFMDRDSQEREEDVVSKGRDGLSKIVTCTYKNREVIIVFLRRELEDPGEYR